MLLILKMHLLLILVLDFEISVLTNYNSNEVLLKCIDRIKKYFNNDRWQINQPIIKSEITKYYRKYKRSTKCYQYSLLNLFDSDAGYSGNTYDLVAATKNRNYISIIRS
jgi:Zn/Cd-binding protein ZinT